MLTITIQVNAPIWAAQGVKEALAMAVERFGDTCVVSIKTDDPARNTRQMEIGGSGK